MKELISKEICKEVIDSILKEGGDFVEVFVEDTFKNAIEMVSGKVTNISSNIIHGASIRILKDTKEIFGYTNDYSLNSLLKLGKELVSGVSGICDIKYEFKDTTRDTITKPEIMPSSVSNEIKINYLNKVYEAISGYSEEISQVIENITDEEQYITVGNSNGVFASDLRTRCRLGATAVSGQGATMQTSSNSIGGNCGYEIFNKYDLKQFGEELAGSAITMSHADEMVGGTMTVVVHNGFGGVLLHEACVHSLEATSVAKGASVFCNKIGEQIASSVVTAIDDGTRFNQWGSINVDDEGTPSQKNVLIENGILKSYLVDYRNSRIMNHPVTGSSRRQNYKYAPTSRMTNTFFAPGKDKFEDIIKATEYGLFAKKMGGGSVNPATGEFNFSVQEGYLIENGKITKPVKGAALVGSGKQVLMNIDMISDNLEFGHGMCGSASGSVPTDVGQPTIRVQNITVGGKGVK